MLNMALLSQQPIGRSESFHALMDRVSDVAALENAALLAGERGTGKELIASRLHFLSPRWEQVYVSLNCAAYNDAELDSALFGQVFYDSRPDIIGAFERAQGGTLFLDHIDHCSARLQEKLLYTLEHNSAAPLGAIEDAADINVRLVTATSVDLPTAALNGHFRADLIDRIAFDVINIPPLRLRLDDIVPLTEHFGRKIVSKLGADRFPGFTPEAMDLLMSQPWPGNIRELKLAVERSVVKAFLADETLSYPVDTLTLDPFAGPYRLDQTSQYAPPTAPQPPAAPQIMSSSGSAASMNAEGFTAQAPAPPQTGPDFSSRVMIFERGLVDEALTVSQGHQGRAADYLGLTYHQFRGLLRKHGLKK